MNRTLVIVISSIILIAIIVAIFLFLPNSEKQEQKTPEEKIQETRPTFINKEEVKADFIIKITDEGYIPNNITIKKGQSIAWINESSDWKLPASDVHPTHTIYPEFDPKQPFEIGKAWVFTFNKVGEWDFHDHLIPRMKGTIKVE